MQIVGSYMKIRDRFPVILADPPWPYATWSNKGLGRSAEAHYDVMSIEDIAAMPVSRWATDDATLLLWVTKPILPKAFGIIDAWGFTYKTVGFTWVKIFPQVDDPTNFNPPPLRFPMGLGHWTRANPEMCLLATRGKPHRINKDVPELLLAPRREHSVKPPEIYHRIERLLGGPYLELFASASAVSRPGWTRWVGKDRAAVRRWRSDQYPGYAPPAGPLDPPRG
jgi:N6-adenosine-specific RNA methylase IME4